MGTAQNGDRGVQGQWARVVLIFVDTNVFMYAVGREHPLRAEARRFFEDSLTESNRLCTSAEVLQELMHAYLPVDRIATLDAVRKLVAARVDDVWSVDEEDADHARLLVERHAGLGARDLLHLACCVRRGVRAIHSYDRALSAAFARG